MSTTAIPTTHRCHLEQSPLGTARSTCTCGWVGKWFASGTEAVEAGTGHMTRQTIVLTTDWAELAQKTTPYTRDALEIERDGERWICRAGLIQDLAVRLNAPHHLVGTLADQVAPHGYQCYEVTAHIPGEEPATYRDSFYPLTVAESVASKVPLMLAGIAAVVAA